MLLEYAIDKDSTKIVHIDEVPNGIKCNCICKACNDELIAKNGGKQKKHHFAHANIEESRSCLMTQLHLAVQYYFLSLKEITIPSVYFEYKGKMLRTKNKKVFIKSSQIEKSVGKYIADIIVNTDAEQYFIEICVTHKCELGKIDFYKENKINSVELTFNQSENRELNEWIDRLKSNEIPLEWFFYQEKENEIFNYEKNLAREENELKKKRVKKVEASIHKLITSKKVFLPSITHELVYSHGNEKFTETVLVYTKKTKVLDKISIIKKEQDFIILKGSIINGEVEYVIWIIYSISDKKPDILKSANDSVIIRRYPKQQDTPEWEWLRHPSLERKKANLLSSFINVCQKKIELRSRRIYISNLLKNLSEEYLNKKDILFQKDYGVWRKWLTKNNLFTPREGLKNPKIPVPLKSRRDYPFLWMFQRWHVLVISELIDIIDNISIGSRISAQNLFEELARKFPLHQVFFELENIAEFRTVQVYERNLIYKNLIILESLEPFCFLGTIKIDDYGVTRLASLKNTLRS
ncbi:hypothetical protein Z042_12335 [Chania multitudinisentens RB-25]|uniref:Competence protein CoiA n=1 Tax=Chania multitudinisentens RB-25 TaxID=1441930 RepID=W0LKA7_9GAMM|nr:hypothetical protein [Chania multitudinisentens]AHG22767.1 hypothetical protein Z042_12335 [Chania multitudinisentens RB-25]